MTAWTHDKIEDLVKQLESFKQEIALSILVLVNAKSDVLALGQEKTNDLVQQGYRDIVEIIAINGNATRSSVGKRATRLERLHQDAQAAAQHRHEEIIAAILTLRNGATEVITRSTQSRQYATGSPKAQVGTPRLEIGGETEWLAQDQQGIDLTQRTKGEELGDLDPVIRRAADVHVRDQILSQMINNNPVLIESAGTGKTVIPTGLTRRKVQGDVSGLNKNKDVSENPDPGENIEEWFLEQRPMTIREATRDAGDNHGSPVAEVWLGNPVLKKVLDCLYFRQMTDRLEEITLVHRKTFAWIFCNPSAEHKPWSNFVDWLEHGTGCYWIGGKAGSGKSTLMKYIHRDVRTRRALEIWAGKKRLVIPSFFFWNLGSSLQKTQKGLLRSLLFDLLNQHQELIPSLFPGLCRTIATHGENDLAEPSFIELKNAFTNLARLKSDSLAVCFFIDGIDEYDGDHEELIELLDSISSPSSSHVKVVLSSRPIPACVAAFSGYAKLYLHDLTYNDMRLYVEDKIGRHPHMLIMKREDSIAAAELMTDITDKASGVFLWVSLAVKSLIHGFHNFDRVSDLRRRLEELPADLERLYDHMLQAMSPLYRQQASHLFQILMASTIVQGEDPLTLLQLSFAEEEDLEIAVNAPFGPLPAMVKASRCDAVEGRLRSRCCGLIEAQDKRGSRCVGFLHRTVVEYLRLDKNWDNIRNLAMRGFDPHTALLSSCLYDLKTYSLKEIVGGSPVIVSRLCRKMSLYAMLAERSTKHAQTIFLDNFNATMEIWWSILKQDLYSARLTSWTSSWTNFADLGESFLVFAIRSGLVLYVDEMLSQDPALAHGDAGGNLLQGILHRLGLNQFSGEEGDSEFDKASEIPHPVQPRLFIDLVNIILQHGAEPNQILSTKLFPTSLRENDTPWSLALDLGMKASHQERLSDFRPGQDGAVLAGIMRLFILHGANPNEYGVSENDCRTALDVVENLFSTSRLRQIKASVDCLIAAQSLGSEIIELLKGRGAYYTRRAPSDVASSTTIGITSRIEGFWGRPLPFTEAPQPKQWVKIFRFWAKTKEHRTKEHPY